MDIKRTTTAEVTLSLDELKEKMKSFLKIPDVDMMVEPIIEYDEYERDMFSVTGIKFIWTE